MSIHLAAPPMLCDGSNNTLTPIDAIEGLGVRTFPFTWEPTFVVSLLGLAGDAVTLRGEAINGVSPIEPAVRTVPFSHDGSLKMAFGIGEIRLTEPWIWRFRLFADDELLLEMPVPVARAI